MLDTKEVSRILKSKNKASDLHIGKMPLVKDMETRHFLVTGSTGSGKTNLIHNLIPQIIKKKQPIIFVDQTGEMISKYCDNFDRADCIFNPLDDRSVFWDFNADCKTREDLDIFAKILIGFNKKHSNDDFWEISAREVFVDTICKLREQGIYDLNKYIDTICQSDNDAMYALLQSKDSARHFIGDNDKVSASIISVLISNIKPLRYFAEGKKTEIDGNTTYSNAASLTEYLDYVKRGDNTCLFLALKPGSRSLTMPIISAMIELTMTKLMNIGIYKDRKLWFVFDELSALGRLPALSQIMTEGRKYEACVIAGLQSLNQIYDNYGHYGGSTIFSQFGTCFYFQNPDTSIASMFSKMCGNTTITKHQKNTSFGANEFRDGVSYNEHQQTKPLLETNALAKLNIGECYVLSNDNSVKIAKIKVPIAKGYDK